MNIKEYVCIDNDINNHYNDNVYGLITELSRHILQTYRSFHRNIQFTYDHDIKIIKHLRIKAFEILLKKSHQLISSQDCKEFQKIDPFLEVQKYAFTLKLGLNRSHDAIMLEYFLQKLEAFSYVELPVSSILQLLIQLKNFNTDSKPIMNIFYADKINLTFPKITYNKNDSLFQIYPMEYFISSDKFEAILEKFPNTKIAPKNIINELNFLYDSKKSKAIGIESTDILVTCDFMSNHIFDKMSSHTLLCPNQRLTISSEFNLCILQNNMS